MCPECKEPVFLRQASKTASACWCHFKGSKSDIALCELRVNSYSDNKRKRLANTARNQLLALLRKHFWKVWHSEPNKIKTHELNEANLLTNHKSEWKTELYKIMWWHHINHAENSKQMLEFYINHYLVETRNFTDGMKGEDNVLRDLEKCYQESTLLHRHYQQNVVSVVFDFLSTAKTREITCAMYLLAIHSANTMDAFNLGDNGILDLNLLKTNKDVRFKLTENVLISLTVAPWWDMLREVI
jgi:hypothetical protein